MTEYLGFQEFTPSEHQTEKKCIWCGKEQPPNRAHIVSRKLTLTSHKSAMLTHSVCQSCNAKCGQLENWILRYTPLGWTRFFYYLSSNSRAKSEAIPSYFYAADEHQWLVYHLEGCKPAKTIDTQLILSKDGQLSLITEGSEWDLHAIMDSLRTGRYTVDARRSLPDDFSPRVLFTRGQLIVVGRTEEEIALLIQALRSGNWQEKCARRFQPSNSWLERQHFKWSRENWLKLCSKISYEALCLFEGPSYCIRSDFDGVRSFILSGVSDKHHEIIFNRHGPLESKDIPNTGGCVDLTNGQNCPKDFVAILPNVEPGMHTVMIYEVDGWVCSSVSLSGFPPCALVLGGPDTHLRDLYCLVYDNQTDEIATTCLAYDHERPVIPLPVEGKLREALIRTYRLRQALL